MHVLIVYAHPEPRSFTGALKDLAVDVLRAAGHEVVVSDLYAMGFDAAGGPSDFVVRADAGVFRYQREQKHAVTAGAFEGQLAGEIAKLERAELVLLHFPFWWFSLPAILKGWVDRVFAFGFAYDAGRSYETGPLAGKRAMLTLTTGAPPASYAPGGRNGDIHELLFHIHHGMLYFVGMDVLPPFIAYGAGRASDEQRAVYLAEYRARLLAIEATPPLPFRAPAGPRVTAATSPPAG